MFRFESGDILQQNIQAIQQFILFIKPLPWPGMPNFFFSQTVLQKLMQDETVRITFLARAGGTLQKLYGLLN
jgi:hypothetical protein